MSIACGAWRSVLIRRSQSSPRRPRWHGLVSPWWMRRRSTAPSPKNWPAPHAMREVEPAAAYDLWAATYDEQPCNPILHLDGILFRRLLATVDLPGRTIVDIGCGTGRHWAEVLHQKPAALSGYDVSAEMLKRLLRK